MRKRQFARDQITAILLIAPSIIAIGIFVYGFIIWSGYVSFSKWDGILPDFRWDGLDNYIKLFGKERFQIDLRNTIFFTISFIIACLVIGLFLAIILDQRIKGENLFRSIFLFPMAISFIVTGV